MKKGKGRNARQRARRRQRRANALPTSRLSAAKHTGWFGKLPGGWQVLFVTTCAVGLIGTKIHLARDDAAWEFMQYTPWPWFTPFGFVPMVLAFVVSWTPERSGWRSACTAGIWLGGAAFVLVVGEEGSYYGTPESQFGFLAGAATGLVAGLLVRLARRALRTLTRTAAPARKRRGSPVLTRSGE